MRSPTSGKTLVVVAALAAVPPACGTRTAPRRSPPLTAPAGPVASFEERLAAARALLAANDLPAALAAFTELDERARLAGDGRARATALRFKGLVHFYRSEVEQAIADAETCIEIAEAIDARSELAYCRQGLGTAHNRLGAHARASAELEKAATLFEELGDKEGLALAFANMGASHAERGDHATALSYFQRSLRLAEELGSKPRLHMALTNIGAIFSRQGDYVAALTYLDRGAAVAEEIGDGRRLAVSLVNVGLTREASGDYAGARGPLERARELAEKHDRSLVPRVLGHLGAVYLQQGLLPEAEAAYGRALQLVQELGNKPDTVMLLADAAGHWLKRQDHARALEAAGRAARLAAEIESLEFQWRALTVAGRAHAALGQADEARQAFAETVAVIEALQQGVAGGAEQEQQAFEEKLGAYHGIMELLLAGGDTAAALQQAERAKGRVLLSVLQNGRIRPQRASTPEEDERERRLKSALASVNARIVEESASAQPDGGRLAALRAERDRLRVEHEAFLATLYASRPEARALRGDMAAATADQAVAVLGPQDAALEFVATEARLHVFLLARDGRGAARVRHQVLAAGRQELGEKVQAFRRQLAGRDPAFRPAARQLFEAVLGPLARELRGRRRLVVVPDGPLWELPFQALLDERDRYLLEDHAIQYAPSLTVLAQMTSRRPGATSLRLLAVGNPTLPGPSTLSRHAALRDAKLTPLPEAEREVKALARLYQARDGADLYVGPEAEERRIKAEASRHGVLHFATHGILDDRRPMYSHLLLSAPARPEGESDAEDDGILEAREIVDLDLRARLVVLSACEMARGRYGPGEGMIGMSWALFVAGSPAAVLAQWKVDSASTTRLMIDFHRGLLGRGRAPGLSKSEALRRAALGLMRSPRYRHPFHWAGFVLLGDDSPLSWQYRDPFH